MPTGGAFSASWRKKKIVYGALISSAIINYRRFAGVAEIFRNSSFSLFIIYKPIYQYAT